MSGQGTFDVLNDALLVQLDRLMTAEREDMDSEIKRSNAVSQLAMNVNRNMSNAVEVAKLLSTDGEDVRGMRAMMPKMLGGGE